MERAKVQNSRCAGYILKKKKKKGDRRAICRNTTRISRTLGLPLVSPCSWRGKWLFSNHHSKSNPMQMESHLHLPPNIVHSSLLWGLPLVPPSSWKRKWSSSSLPWSMVNWILWKWASFTFLWYIIHSSPLWCSFILMEHYHSNNSMTEKASGPQILKK